MTKTQASTSDNVDSMVELLQAGMDNVYTVTVNSHGWIDIRNNRPQMDSTAKLDFLRVWQEDINYWRLVHLTHNEVIKGEASFSGSLVGALFAAVRDFFESL